MTHPLVSIIMPVYNAERFLEEAIQSALEQTWPAKELIIVNDGSTDSSLSIALKYQSNNVQVIDVENGGAAKARNIGFKHANGEFIQYLDADDLMKSDKIEIQMTRLLNQPDPQTLVCAGQWLRFNQTLNDVLGGVGPGPQAEKDMSPLDWLLLRPYNLMTVHAWLTPRYLIELAGSWNESMTLDDDGEFFIRVVSHAEQVLFCDAALSYYRTNESYSLSKYNGNHSKDSCLKLRSAYSSLQTYRTVLSPFGDLGRTAIARNSLYLAFESYLVCTEVYESCFEQDLPVRQNLAIYRFRGGKIGVLSLLLGWRTAKRMMQFLESLKYTQS